jgi:hypothetical protein
MWLVFSPVQSADQYQVQRYNRLEHRWDFSDSSIFTESCSSIACWVEAPGLEVQQNAIWRVRAHNSMGWGPWSELVYFDVVPGSGG